MHVPDARLLESGSEVIIRMLVYQDARLFRCSNTEKRFRRDDTGPRQPDALNITARFLNAFTIGFVLLSGHRSTIVDLNLTGFQ